MPEVSDVDLMRLADGTLADPRLSAVEAEVAARPELQQQLEAYLATGKALAQLFGPIAEAPVPERLLATIQTGAAAPSMRLHRAAPMHRMPRRSEPRARLACRAASAGVAPVADGGGGRADMRSRRSAPRSC